MGKKFSDAARAELAIPIDAAATTIEIKAGGGLFPLANTGASPVSSNSDWFKLVLQDNDGIEIVYVRTHASGSNVFSDVLRGQDSTSPKGFSVSSIVGQRMTAEDANFFQQAAERPTPTPVFLDGMVEVDVKKSAEYTITNYNAFSEYFAQVSAGAVSLAGDKISFTAPESDGDVVLTVTMDGVPKLFSIGVLPVFNNFIETPAPTPAIGSAFEGGFYSGMFWNQLTQSATSMEITTGLKTFIVPDMAVDPIVYEGQILEVRSRANPTNKMVGVVASAINTELFLNVTSVGGAGTFDDWSIMATYRNITAPKSSGEIASIAWKNANTAGPSACQTLTEGWLATVAMQSAGDATTYPMAHWARSLIINGRSDWHIPARDIRELEWRNLKPTTDNNYITANRPTGGFNYKNLGSYGDDANTHGLNNNSSPPGSAYTAGSPGQTDLAAFKAGGAEAFEYGAAYFWTSSEYNASSAWFQYWPSSNPGSQLNSNKTNAYRARAARRSII